MQLNLQTSCLSSRKRSPSREVLTHLPEVGRAESANRKLPEAGQWKQRNQELWWGGGGGIGVGEEEPDVVEDSDGSGGGRRALTEKERNLVGERKEEVSVGGGVGAERRVAR